MYGFVCMHHVTAETPGFGSTQGLFVIKDALGLVHLRTDLEINTFVRYQSGSILRNIDISLP